MAALMKLWLIFAIQLVALITEGSGITEAECDILDNIWCHKICCQGLWIALCWTEDTQEQDRTPGCWCLSGGAPPKFYCALAVPGQCDNLSGSSCADVGTYTYYCTAGGQEFCVCAELPQTGRNGTNLVELLKGTI